MYACVKFIHYSELLMLIHKYIFPQDHGKFVQSVRFSPSGDRFATGGFDGKIFVYNGTSSDLEKELGSPAHKGGIYAVSYF